MPRRYTGTVEFLAITTLCLSLPAPADGGSAWAHHAEDDRVGRIYYYERSNADGSMDERITVFRKSTQHIEVYKENGLCRRAALVSATLDLDTLSTPVITGGSLEPGARHRDFAFIEPSPDGRQLNMRVRLPDGEIRNEAEIRSTPWTLYDFDLAGLTVATPHIDRRTDGFSFGMVLLWADPASDDPFYWMGEVDADFAGRVERLGVAAEKYRLTGSALRGERSTGPEGTLWLDSREGHIVDAVLPVPNHPGYRDFRLRLLKFSDGGEAEWNALLTAHFEGCS